MTQELLTILSNCDEEIGKTDGLSRIKTQKQVIDESREFISDRMAGKFNYIKTSYNNLNLAFGGGIETNTILTIAAMSSGGKSTLAARICNDACQLNTGREIVVLNFNFEMLAHKLVGRELCNMMEVSSQELYNSKLPTADKLLLQAKIEEHYKSLEQYDIFYVEEPLSYKTVVKNIMYYWDKLCKRQNRTLIVQIDHVGIVLGERDSDAEKEKIDGIMQELNRAKKIIANKGGNAIFMVLNQFNRNIESVERKQIPSLHYPQQSDMFGASSVYQYSDYVLCTHNPSKLHLQKYTEHDLPIWLGNKERTTSRDTEFIYWSIIKNREGTLKPVMPMLSNFKNFNFEELTIEDFDFYRAEFKQSGFASCYRK